MRHHRLAHLVDDQGGQQRDQEGESKAQGMQPGAALDLQVLAVCAANAIPTVAATARDVWASGSDSGLLGGAREWWVAVHSRRERRQPSVMQRLVSMTRPLRVVNSSWFSGPIEARYWVQSKLPCVRYAAHLVTRGPSYQIAALRGVGKAPDSRQPPTSAPGRRREHAGAPVGLSLPQRARCGIDSSVEALGGVGPSQFSRLAAMASRHLLRMFSALAAPLSGR